MQSYELGEADGITLFIALKEIRDNRTRRCSSTPFAGRGPVARPRRQRRLWVHVVARLPRRVSEVAAARHADRLRASQDAGYRLELRARAESHGNAGVVNDANIATLPPRSGCLDMRLAKFVKFREEKFGGVLFETRSEKVFTLSPTATAIVREIGAGDERAISARL